MDACDTYERLRNLRPDQRSLQEILWLNNVDRVKEKIVKDLADTFDKQFIGSLQAADPED